MQERVRDSFGVKGEVDCLLLLPSSLIGRWCGHSILAPPRGGGLCAISLEEQEEAGLEQGEGEQGVGLMLLADGKGEEWEALATAALISPAPGFWPMWRRAGWLRKREEGRPPPWPPEAPSITLLPPSRLERGSWPPLAARAERGGGKGNESFKCDVKNSNALTVFIFGRMNKKKKNQSPPRSEVAVAFFVATFL